MNTTCRAALLLAAALLLTACNDDDNPAPAPTPTPTTYTVTPSGDAHVSVAPATPQTVTDGDTLTFTLTPDSEYLLDASAGGSCPTGSFSGNTYTTGAVTADCTVMFSTTPLPATLALSNSILALSVTGGTATGAPTGSPRVLTLTNTSAATAFNLALGFPSFPAGTTATTTCGGSLAAADSCTVTITPGATATSDGTNPCTTGTAPVPGTLSVGADNASTVQANVVVLGYGCIWQGGYVFAFDDTTPITSNVGGKVAATADQAAPYPNGVLWGADGTGTVDYADIAGTDDADTTPCVGARDGACNTLQITDYHETSAPGAPVNLANYAAGLCKQTIAGYSDWYLPAACEMGYEGAGCGTAGTPALDNLQSNLVDRNGLGLLAGFYWSSTEFSAQPAQSALGYYFASGGGATTTSAQKADLMGARCARAITP